MKFIYLRIKSFFNSITGSIAFYPTLYAVLALGFAFIMKWLESIGISRYLQDSFSPLVVNDIETARNILTTLIAGGISILVFSFSMVMLLLSQAATNYSPRVLPSLISNKTHQVILGAFLSSIIYNIITIIGIEPTGKDYQIPGFSVLIGIITALIALGAFVYFIHSISSSIQINNILKNIYQNSKDQLETEINNDNNTTDFPNTTDWDIYNSYESGTIQNISSTSLKSYCLDQSIQIEVLFHKGEYLITDSPLFKSNKKLNDDQVKEILKNFLYQESEIVKDNYTLGFKQITEIGIKAMSPPGINDPGTAINTINFLTDLFAIRLKRSDHSIIIEGNKPIIKLSITPFNHFIHNILAPYRNYCNHDFTVMMSLIQMINRLKKCNNISNDYVQTLDHQLELMMHDAENGIKNPIDLKILKSTID
ncbi:hypothetical protein JCM19298_1633 [Nonlabens ulvanivorans]|nr:DUF2254 domain-containing protein [Nonlabens ulvanivorans]GAK95304.1 hypothetical protein JCM19298_1633 [Nonlabens ulvanivorans]